jgi:hypothetical protein
VLYRSRTARLNGFAIARISVVALLWLALLAGMLPSGALSASHACRMACCAGKPPHEAGACNAALPGAEPAASPSDEAQASDDEHSAHHEQMQMSVTVDQTATDTHVASGHCETTKHSSVQAEAAIQPQAAAQSEALAQPQASIQSQASVQAQAAAQHQEAQPRAAPAQQQASIAASVFTKPCSEECAAAAFAGVQLRRPRPAATLALALKPRPPTLISRADCFNSLLPSSAARRRQSRPRAPPVSLVNPFA